MADLVPAWKAWDRKPGADITAHRMEDECQAEAKALGVDATELRILLATLVRKGATRDEALERARELFAE